MFDGGESIRYIMLSPQHTLCQHDIGANNKEETDQQAYCH